MDYVHKTVLLHETVHALEPKQGGVYVDATLGAGGHSHYLCSQAPKSTIIGIDADADAVARATKRLADSSCTFKTSIAYNDQFNAVLEEHGITNVDGVMVDLGMSSDQLEQSGRGFSFMRDEPLLMTMPSDHTGMTAQTIVNEFTEEQIATIIAGYSDERYAKRIATAIVAAREKQPITTTTVLRNVIAHAVPQRYRNRKTHPATKTFQALRIAVNDEIDRLRLLLQAACDHLVPGGRLAVISFHSIEDRIVKRFMREQEDAGVAIRVTKKPIVPSEEEIAQNPRARSAKLRILEKK